MMFNSIWAGPGQRSSRYVQIALRAHDGSTREGRKANPVKYRMRMLMERSNFHESHEYRREYENTTWRSYNCKKTVAWQV